MPATSTNPSLTVAIPTCNGARHLAEALRSVLSQEGVAFELVVSDDRSDDDTLEVVRRAAGDRRGSKSTASGSAWRETGTGARPWRARRCWRSSIRTT